MMNKEQKKNYISEMTTQFENSKAILVTHYQGLTMTQLDELRAKGNLEKGIRIGKGLGILKVVLIHLNIILQTNRMLDGRGNLFFDPDAFLYPKTQKAHKD